jgi:hypothetical protein
MACSEFRGYAVCTRLKAELQRVSATFAHYLKMDSVLGADTEFHALALSVCNPPQPLRQEEPGFPLPRG